MISFFFHRIMGPIEKLILFSIGMLTLPIGGFFTSKSFLFEGEGHFE
jgi:hypothetical protein